MSIKERLKKKTPKRWKLIGGALLATGGALATYSFFTDDHILKYVVAACLAVGSFLTNLAVAKGEA